MGICGFPHGHPPSADRSYGEFSGVARDADTHEAIVAGHVIHPVRYGLGHAIREVVRQYFRPLAREVPLAPLVGVLANKFLFLRVHRDRRLAKPLVSFYSFIDSRELRVSVWVVSAFEDLFRRLQGETLLVEQAPHGLPADRVSRGGEFHRQGDVALRCVHERRLRIPAGRWLKERPKCRYQGRVESFGPLSTPARSALKPARWGVMFDRLRSIIPRRIVLLDRPVARWTASVPPNPNSIASLAANKRRLRSSSVGENRSYRPLTAASRSGNRLGMPRKGRNSARRARQGIMTVDNRPPRSRLRDPSLAMYDLAIILVPGPAQRRAQAAQQFTGGPLSISPSQLSSPPLTDSRIAGWASTAESSQS